MYEKGKGVEKDPKEAERLYKSAADKGHIGAGKAGEWLKSYKRARTEETILLPFLAQGLALSG